MIKWIKQQFCWHVVEKCIGIDLETGLKVYMCLECEKRRFG
jgi:hypothetical protein